MKPLYSFTAVNPSSQQSVLIDMTGAPAPRPKPVELVYCLQYDGSMFKREYLRPFNATYKRVGTVPIAGVEFDVILGEEKRARGEIDKLLFLGHWNDGVA